MIGNGYKWKKGELVDQDNIYEKRYQLRKPIKKAEFPNETYWEQMHEITKTLSNTDMSCNSVVSKYSFSWYPLSESSYLYRVPKNIKADWQALREECIALLKEDGILPEEFNKEGR